MWCKTCNIETNEELCPVCGSVTIEDIPTEVYWCTHCEVPIIQVTTQADKGFCPLCAKKMKYLSADLRPVFPEERLLLELLLGEEPFAYIEKSVWAANSRYYINGKSVSISSKTFQDADTDALSQKLKQYRDQNTVEEIEDAIANLIEKEYVVYLKRSNDYLRLKQTSGVDIGQKIRDSVAALAGKVSTKATLNASNFDNYIYPSRYNDEREMTRYSSGKSVLSIALNEQLKKRNLHLTNTTLSLFI